MTFIGMWTIFSGTKISQYQNLGNAKAWIKVFVWVGAISVHGLTVFSLKIKALFLISL
jgi:hypothetical protein